MQDFLHRSQIDNLPFVKTSNPFLLYWRMCVSLTVISEIIQVLWLGFVADVTTTQAQRPNKLATALTLGRRYRAVTSFLSRLTYNCTGDVWHVTTWAWRCQSFISIRVYSYQLFHSIPLHSVVKLCQNWNACFHDTSAALVSFDWQPDLRWVTDCFFFCFPSHFDASMFVL